MVDTGSYADCDERHQGTVMNEVDGYGVVLIVAGLLPPGRSSLIVLDFTVFTFVEFTLCMDMASLSWIDVSHLHPLIFYYFH